ncbi:MAG TPA: helix-turn-helix domain-containing protein [Candidatus Butyricicoccus avicola]|nr:helix-turn-helix domain-containing protein [uncultured Agathobaculum sp.]HJC22022.1 helix-turn-helix domain-containing protein [Candidatus Butyricicoccus avicola]
MPTDAGRKYELPEFRERLDKLRGSRTYADFADFLGMSRATVGFYLAGKRIPNAADLKKIAQKCEVTADYLIGLDRAPTHESSDFADRLGISSDTVDKIELMKEVFTALPDRDGAIPALDAMLSSKSLAGFLVRLADLAAERKARQTHTANLQDAFASLVVDNATQHHAYITGKNVIPLSPGQYEEYTVYMAKKHFDEMVDEIVVTLCNKDGD